MPLTPREFVEKYRIRSIACCFSGGRDSLVSTHYVMSELEDVNVVKVVVHVDTGVMLPITRRYVEDVCRRFGWKLVILYGGFFEKAEKWGMPTMRRRWCCYWCKIKPIADFMETLQGPRAEVTGLRAQESPRRAKILKGQVWFRRRSMSWVYDPILYWSDKGVKKYIEDHGLPEPPHYRLGLKETCMCGVFATKREMLILKAQFPQLWKKFVELEEKFRKRGTAFYFNYRPVSVKEISRQKMLQDYIGGEE